MGFWASSESGNLVIMNSWHSRVTDRKAVTNYCVTVPKDLVHNMKPWKTFTRVQYKILRSVT